MNKCFINIKTTGLFPNKHNIIDLTAMIENSEQKIDVFTSKMNPGSELCLDPNAAMKMGLSAEIINTYPNQLDVYYKFTQFLQPYMKEGKIMLVGYNMQFITEFLIQWFKRNTALVGTEEKMRNCFFDLFYLPGLDLMQMANLCLLESRDKIENFSFANICTLFDLNYNNEKHSSFYDTKQAYALFNKLTKEVL